MKNLILATLLLTTACTTIEQNRGAELREVKVDQITPTSNKNDVYSLLGSPSTKSTYGQETWYYINSKTQRQIIQGNKVLKQNVLAISFDESGYVSNMESYDDKDAREVASVSRKTPTAGRELTVVEQILGNVGKFNTDTMQTGSNPTGSGSRSSGSTPGSPY